MEKVISFSIIRWLVLNLLGCIVVVFCFYNTSFAKDYCLDKYGTDTKRWSSWYFGIDYPWWYNVALYKVESNCVWKRSNDGWGSIGIAQITPIFWDKVLVSKGLKEYKNDKGVYVKAYLYILKDVYNSVTFLCSEPTNDKKKKLWIMYQGYNRSISKLNKEVSEAGVCEYERWKLFCKEKDICVWKTVDGCKQWRNGCDINSMYSVKVFKEGRVIRDKLMYENDGNWLFW